MVSENRFILQVVGNGAYLRKLRIAYFPLSLNLQHPGDRRRLIRWARARKHEIQIGDTRNCDLAVLSQGSEFPITKLDSKIPKLMDLVDSFGLSNSRSEDILRGISKNVPLKSNGIHLAYSKFILSRVSLADAVVCSSEEQAEYLLRFNSRVFPILDSHDEIPEREIRPKRRDNRVNLFWEGQPFTIPPLSIFESPYFSPSANFHFNMVSDLEYFEFLRRFRRQRTLDLISQTLPSYSHSLSKWSIGNLLEFANSSDIAVIPVNDRKPIQFLKPENRLMIMFRLGIPVVCSRTPSHLRVEKKLGIQITSECPLTWKKLIMDFWSDEDLANHLVKKGKWYLKNFHNDTVLFEKWDTAVHSIT